VGALLLHCGRPAEAEAQYRADLRQWEGNAWSLFGLANAMRAQVGTVVGGHCSRWTL
jgi:hypothetical protein